MFDKRDTGLSDRGAGEDSLEQREGDLRAVMRACGSDRAVLFGYSEGGPMSIQFAARYPARVGGLILAAASARWPAAPGYPCGEATAEMSRALEDRTLDVRDLLPGITVPVLIIQRLQDRITPPVHGRYLASQLPGARYFEQPGDHLLWVGDTDAMFGAIQEFLKALDR